MTLTMEFARASNQLKCKRNGLSYVGQNVGWDDQRVECTIAVLPTTLYSHVGLIARSNSTADTMYALQLIKGTGGCYLQLYGVVGGTYNLLYQQDDPGAGNSTIEVGHTMILDVTGNVVTVASDDEWSFQAVNNLIPTGAYAGIGMDNTVARIDDWSATKSTTLSPLAFYPATYDFSTPGDLPSPWYYNANAHLVGQSGGKGGGIGGPTEDGNYHTVLIDLPGDDFKMTFDWIFNTGDGVQIQFRTQPGGGTVSPGDATWYQIAANPSATSGATFNKWTSAGGFTAEAFDAGFNFLANATANHCVLTVVGDEAIFTANGNTIFFNTCIPVSGGRTIQITLHGDVQIDNVVLTAS